MEYLLGQAASEPRLRTQTTRFRAEPGDQGPESAVVQVELPPGLMEWPYRVGLGTQTNLPQAGWSL